MKHFLIALIGLIPTLLLAQDHEARLKQIDVTQYRFRIEIDDDSDQIEGQAVISIQFKEATQGFTLDLVEKSEKTGMQVKKVEEIVYNPMTKEDESLPLPYQHLEEELRIQLKGPASPGQERKFYVEYEGIPGDGLIISQNRHGERTIFGDNWPNRAHHWLPCVDHPSDKAPVTWDIIYPQGYKVVANGVLKMEGDLKSNKLFAVYEEITPLPTKVMVFGMAKFETELVGKVGDIPVSSWVFPQDTAKGFEHYDDAMGILATFIDSIGPYAYQKLANVQSKTRYGGMENANTVFYYEASVDNEIVPLLAHELAHQWFGNMATEGNWHHIWLSEGFATYMTDLYIQWTYGDEKFKARMAREREKVLRFRKSGKRPVVDELVTDYNQLLNPNSYEMGAWILHMLRHKLGYPVFMKGIRTYYERFGGKNALSKDFQAVMEEVSGKDLTAFFTQWLYRQETPQLEITWKMKKGGKRMEVKVAQLQDGEPFHFPLEVGLWLENDEWTSSTWNIDRKKTTFEINTSENIRSVEWDPGVKLLARIKANEN